MKNMPKSWINKKLQEQADEELALANRVTGDTKQEL